MATDEDKRDIIDNVGRDVFRAFGVHGAYWTAGAVVATAWLLYLLNAAFHVDVLALLHPERQQKYGKPVGVDTATIELIVAIAITLIMIPWSIAKARKVRRLASTGVRTRGQVVSMSPLGRHGLSPATIIYSVDGRQYTIKKDILRDAHEVGGGVDIMYDPANPGRCELM